MVLNNINKFLLIYLFHHLLININLSSILYKYAWLPAWLLSIAILGRGRIGKNKSCSTQQTDTHTVRIILHRAPRFTRSRRRDCLVQNQTEIPAKDKTSAACAWIEKKLVSNEVRPRPSRIATVEP